MDNNIQGWINLYKPKNITSFFALKKIKKKFNIHKLGHAGTLDPLAEGILPIALGKTTKLIPFVSNRSKKYIFTIKWGEQSSTDDKEGKITNKSNIIPDENSINNAIKKFKGIKKQIPPLASATKVNGHRAYSLLRNKKNFILQAKEVFLKEIKLINCFTNKTATFEIECGKGYYVRSLARDLANSLNTFGHIIDLKRTKVGFFDNKSSILLDDLLKIRQTDFEFNCIHSSMSVLDDILAYEIEEEEDITNLSFGKSIKINKSLLIKPSLNSEDKNIVFLSQKGKVISFGKLDGDLFKPIKILI